MKYFGDILNNTLVNGKFYSKNVRYIFFSLLIILITACMQSNSSSDTQQGGYLPPNGYVPNAETAIKIAEAVWLPIYGDEIYKYKPFKADLIQDTIWKVYGTVYTDKGGSPIAEIQKSDCKILSIYHEK